MSGELRQREPSYRNRKLLDLAHAMHECMNCGTFVAHGCDPAHANWQEFGKAGATKASDCFHAALCGACHGWLDSGKGVDPSGCYDGVTSDKRAMWIRAAFRTLEVYWRSGWVTVSGRVL